MKRAISAGKGLQLMTAPAYFDNIETMTDEAGESSAGVMETVEIAHAEPGELQMVKSSAKGHGEQTILPDDCEFGDNELCYVEQ